METCNFEVDSSSSEDQENDEEPRRIPNKESEMSVFNKSQILTGGDDNSGIIASSYIEGIGQAVAKICTDSIGVQPKCQDISSSNIERLKNMCSMQKHLITTVDKISERELKKTDSDSERTLGLHRQVRFPMRKLSTERSTIEESREKNQYSVSTSPESSDVFVPPSVSPSPMKFVPIVKKSAIPRRYTNVRLFKGKRYQYRRFAPSHSIKHNTNPQSAQSFTLNTTEESILNMTSTSQKSISVSQSYQASTAVSMQQNIPQLSQNTTQLLENTHQINQSTHEVLENTQQMHQSTNQMHQQNVVQFASHSVLPTQTVVNQNSFSVQPSYVPSPHYQIASSPQIHGNISSNVHPLPQLVNVVSGPSVAVPQGYALQYVGSYRDREIASPNIISYQSPHSVIIPQPIVMAANPQPQVPLPPPSLLPQVVNSNFTFNIANPETVIINQTPSILPGFQYVSQSPQNLQQPVLQSIDNVLHVSQHVQSATPLISNLTQSSQIHNMTTSGSSQFKTAVSLESWYTNPSISVNSSHSNALSCKNRPQAHIAPISNENLNESRKVKIEISPPAYSRPLFPQTTPISRSVATVAPAVFTSTSSLAYSQLQRCKSKEDIPNKDRLTPDISSKLTLSGKPRPTYSYRDAMRNTDVELKRCRQASSDTMDSSKSLSDDGTDSERDNVIDTKSDSSDSQMQSYKLVLSKDKISGSKFNVKPLSVPETPLPSPEVKELRIKAKVSVGPKRKKPSAFTPERYFEQNSKELFLADKDVTNDPFVNEQNPNMSVNFNPPRSGSSVLLNDLIDRPKTGNNEPRIVFELTSEDGFKVEAHHVSEVWQKVFDAVSEARENLRTGCNRENIPECSAVQNTKDRTLSGLQMLGLTHNAVQYLLEQLPGAKDCHKYSFQVLHFCFY